MEHFKNVLKKYAVFTGRSTRPEYWYFVLFSVIISFVLGFIDSMLGLTKEGQGFFSGIFSLVTLIPSIAVGVRRLHDTGKSGWWTLLVFVPILGWIPLIIFLATDSTPGVNQYGSSEKKDLSVLADMDIKNPTTSDSSNSTTPPASV